MNQGNIIPDPDETNPTNTSSDGAEPEMNKDLSHSVQEEDTENADPSAESAENGQDSTAREDREEIQNDHERPDDRPHGIENGDEDHQNPYPDENDQNIKK